MRQRLRHLGNSRLAAVIAIVVITPLVVAALVVVGGRDDDAKKSRAGAARAKPKSFLVDLIPPKKGQPRRSAPEDKPRLPRPVARRLSKLSIEQKVAQVFLVGFQGSDLTAPVFVRLRRLGLGGIVVGTENYTDSVQLSTLAGEARVIADQEKHVMPWVMAEQEGGEFNVFADLPPATAASRLPGVDQAVKEADLAGRTLRPLGVNGVLAPVVDVPPGTDAAVGPRAYSDDPEAVAAYAEGVVSAYRRAGVLSVVRHFPGLGSAAQSTREGPATVGLSLKELGERDLIPFRAAIDAGAPAVLLSNALYAPDDFVVPGSLSRRIATDLLRDKLGFRGVAITDDLADPAITALGPVPDSAVKALGAGADLLYISGGQADQEAAYDSVLSAVKRGDVSRARLDEAVGRVLSVKLDYGLLR